VTQRHADREFDAPPCLLVVNGLGRARDASPPRGDTDRTRSDDARPESVTEMLAEILCNGPEVGVHVVMGCDSIDQFERRMGRLSLAEFGMCVATAMDEEDSITLLDNTYAATLRPNQALLADEDQGRMIKFRPYLLPPPGWCLPPPDPEG
jgi:DNA segregation ATPase FtsK/SpoIIIE, S-DNA-T family